jgi:RNA polymerase sigma factor (sigma-70 family)
MWLRHSHCRDRHVANAPMPAPCPSPDSDFDLRETARALGDAVGNIAEPFRTTLRLRYYEGLEPTEIARRLGLPASTVRRRHQIGLRRLRDGLGERLDELAPAGWRGKGTGTQVTC